MATSSDPYAAQYVPISATITEPARPAILVNGGPPPSSPVTTLPSAFVSSGTAGPASPTPGAPVYVTSGQSFATSAVPAGLSSGVSYGSQQAPPPPQGSFYISAAPIAAAGPPPTLLPPVTPSFRDAGWGGRWSATSSGDLPGIRTLRGGIVTCLMVLLVCSLFACLGRADFSFVLYLLGYHLWCVEADTKSVTGVKRLLRGARQYAVLLCIASVVEITWLFIAYSTWVCEKGDAELCFPESENLKVRWTYGVHNWALGLSTFCLLVKLLLIFLSFTWVQQQRNALGLGSGGSAAGGTSILPPSSE